MGSATRPEVIRLPKPWQPLAKWCGKTYMPHRPAGTSQKHHHLHAIAEDCHRLNARCDRVIPWSLAVNARVNNKLNNVPGILVPGWQPSSAPKVPTGPALPPKPAALRPSMENMAGLASRPPSHSGNASMAGRVSNDRLSAFLGTNPGAASSSHSPVYGQTQSASTRPLPYPDDKPHLPNRYERPRQQGGQGWGQPSSHAMPPQPYAPPPVFPQRPSYAPALKHSLSFGNLQHVTSPQPSSLPYPLYNPLAQGHYVARPEARPYALPLRPSHSEGNLTQAAAYPNPSRPYPPHANLQGQGNYPAWQQARPSAQPLGNSHSHERLPQAAYSSPQAQGHYAARPPTGPYAHPLRHGHSEGNLAQAAARPQRPPLQPASTWPASHRPVTTAQAKPAMASTTAASRPIPLQASGVGGSAFDAMKPIGEYSNDKYDMRQSLLASLPEKKKNRFGITKSDSPQDALRRQHIYHCLEVMDGYMDGQMNYVVKAGEKPAGMLSMSALPDNRGVKINGVIALPDTKGVGLHAIRAAIEKSMKVGGGGRVELNYLPSNSANLRAFYTKAGFVEHGYFNDAGNYVTHMVLDANKAKEFLRNTEGNSPRFVS